MVVFEKRIVFWPGCIRGGGLVRLGRNARREGAHDLLRAGIGGRTNPHASAQQPLTAAAAQNGERRVWLAVNRSDSGYLRPPEIPTSFDFSL